MFASVCLFPILDDVLYFGGCVKITVLLPTYITKDAQRALLWGMGKVPRAESGFNDSPHSVAGPEAGSEAESEAGSEAGSETSSHAAEAARRGPGREPTLLEPPFLARLPVTVHRESRPPRPDVPLLSARSTRRRISASKTDVCEPRYIQPLSPGPSG